MALTALAEQVELADAGAPPPSHGVRLALAVLFTCSKGDREPFDAFWSQMRDAENWAWSSKSASYRRTSHLQARLRAVMRDVGIEPTVAAEQMLSDAARGVHAQKPGEVGDRGA